MRRDAANARLWVVAATLTCLIAFSVWAFAACGGGSPGEPTSPSGTPTPDATLTPTSGPTAVPTASETPGGGTPTRTPTVGPTDTPAAPGDSETLPVSSITVPVCQSRPSGGSSNQGTAPGPTPTPAPLPEDRDPAEVAAELSGYLSHVKPAADYLWFWNEWFNAAWPWVVTAEGQAALLHQFGNRLAQACAAFAAVQDVPLEAAGIDTLLSEAARTRHAWVRVAVERLQCCGKVTDPDIATGNASTSQAVAGVLSEISGFAEDFGAEAGEGYTLRDDELGVEVAISAGWLSAADGLTLVFVAPVQFHAAGLAGLGPESWQIGSGVRVRRLRNTDQLTPAEASEQFVGLVTRQGAVESTAEIELSGLPALRHELSTETPGWSATMTVTVAGEFTYFVETGCVTGVSGSCEEVERLVSALVITS